MLQADWLTNGTLSVICVQWLEVTCKMAMLLLFFQSFGGAF